MITLAGPTQEQMIREAAQFIAQKTGRVVPISRGVVASPTGAIVTYCICPDEGDTDPACPKHGGA